jgi:hypothetical protein
MRSYAFASSRTNRFCMCIQAALAAGQTLGWVRRRPDTVEKAAQDSFAAATRELLVAGARPISSWAELPSPHSFHQRAACA